MCYFTFCFRLHKVVTAICLAHLNHHYSDVLGDDTLGCSQCSLPSWLLNNKMFLARDSNTALIFSWKPIAVFFFFCDIHKLLTHNMPPFVSLISAFYHFPALEASLWESLFSSLKKAIFVFLWDISSLCCYLQWPSPYLMLLIKEARTDRDYLLWGWDRGDTH